MIIKSIGRKGSPGKAFNFAPLLKYITKHHFDDKNPNASESFIYTHNIRGSDVMTLAKLFSDNEKYRTRRGKNQNMMVHTVLSFHVLDREHITPAKLKAVIKEFIKQKDLKGMYVACPHYDKGHIHIHVASGTIQYKHSKSLHQKKREFKILKISMDEFQKKIFPELIHSRNNHTKRKQPERLTDPEYQLSKRGKVSEKDIIKEQLSYAMNISASIEELNEHLKEAGIPVYSRGGKVYGVVGPNRRHYRFGTLGFGGKVKELENLTIEQRQITSSLKEVRREKSKSHDWEI